MLEDWTLTNTIAVIGIVVSTLMAGLAIWANHRRAEAERKARRRDLRNERETRLREEAVAVVATVKARILTHSPDSLSTLPFEDRAGFIDEMIEAWYRGGVAERVERLCGMRDLEHVPRMAKAAKLDIVSYLNTLSHVNIRDRPVEPTVPSVAEVLDRLDEQRRSGDRRRGLPPRVTGQERDVMWTDAQYAWDEARLGTGQLEETIWGRGPHNEDIEE